MAETLRELADEILYSRFLKERDESLFKELLERHRNSLTLFLNGMVGSMEDAEELMIDAFALIASGTVHYVPRRDCSFKTWLFAIGRNKARMLLRKRKPIFTELSEDINSESSLPEPELFEKEDRIGLYKALREINPDYRQVLFLTYFESMKPDEIARILKKNIKQVYNLTTRGREALKAALERNGFDYAEY
ncbi:MAG: RNA polymerase sigma factor [Lachnospiraceae bacterium]|nr:RNA polymerase sigma factor [Lachnospiraceae bacterium]